MNKLELADKVEANTQSTAQERAMHLGVLYGLNILSPAEWTAKNGNILTSTDAALQLLEECLPGYQWACHQHDGMFIADVALVGQVAPVSGCAKHPAQAILSALLRALHAKENGK